MDQSTPFKMKLNPHFPPQAESIYIRDEPDPLHRWNCFVDVFEQKTVNSLFENGSCLIKRLHICNSNMLTTSTPTNLIH